MNTISSLLKFLGNTLGANPTTTLTTTSKTLVGALNEINAKVAEDYVVAQSEAAETTVGTGTWRWREWNSGKVEIWYSGSVTLNLNPAAAGGVNRYLRRISFPNGYTLYKTICVIDGASGGGWLNCGGLFNSSEVHQEPYTILEVMAYQVNGLPSQNQNNVNIYICGEKSA